MAQSAAFIMVGIARPAAATAEVEAALVECAVYPDIPALQSIVLIHLAKVAEDTGLQGLL